ncbi:hypothetical protein PPYR_01427 [Photinus pyralis]|uniref:HAT C-terminal dimerisation domain-containing protein n=4 Tax=Photinus pyralis TaxID=7054 RepID=A0A5N4B4B4_PHOPY|nr:uncharacterized protein LOC116160391 [Photinus pyralis]KAB0804457.1 hypothetical protein PPYR_01427 [Photinus pyralis]
MSPISIISHDSFKNMFEGMNVHIMDRSVAVKKINVMYENTCNDLKLEISKVGHVCTTADIWSSKSRSFLGVTCHWLNEDLQRRSVALACSRFAGTHSYDRVAEALDDIHKRFHLDTNKILATVTDNGSNFVKCFKEFGCNIDTINDEYTGIEEDDEEDNSDTMKPCIQSDDEYCTFLTLDLSETQVDVEKKYLPQHVRCASHTINLIATTDYNNSLKISNALRLKNTQIFSKCSKLWNKSGRPKSAEVIKHFLGHNLTIPGVTRWNSTYDAVCKIVSIKEKLAPLCDKLMIPGFKQSEVSFLEEYITIMQPLAETLDFLQGEQNTYYGYLLPSLVSMKTKLQKIKSSGKIKQLYSPLEAIINSVEQRFKDIFSLNMNSKTAVIAAVVCPRFKMRWYSAFKVTTNDIPSFKEIQGWVVAAVESFIEETKKKVTVVSESDDPFFDFQEDESEIELPRLKNDIDANTNASLSELEVLKYLNDTRITLDMLNDYKYIKQVFLKFNTILPSSASVERLFSFAQIVNAPRRNALSDQNFEKLVVLKANLK